MDNTIKHLKSKLQKRRAELRAREIESRKKKFDALPAERRKAFEAIGWSPYQDGAIIRREFKTIEVISK